MLNITQGMYLADLIPVLGQFYGFELLSGDLDLKGKCAILDLELKSP